MDYRVALLALLVLAGNCVSDARTVSAISGVVDTEKKINVCSLCQEYTTLAVDYLTDNKTQNEVLETLHNACSGMRNMADQCVKVVDEYAQLFFSEVSSVQPEDLCKSVGLCRNAMTLSLPSKADKCDVCHEAVDEVLKKLKDPDTELGIIETLLKACNAAGKYKSKCKKAVFEFGPVILVDAGSFIEKLDICTTFRACAKPQAETDEVLAKGNIEMVTSS